MLTKLEKSDKEARESHQHLRPTFDADDGQGAYAQLQHHPYPYTEYVFKLQFRQNGGTATRRVVDEAKQPFSFLAWPVRRGIPLPLTELTITRLFFLSLFCLKISC